MPSVAFKRSHRKPGGFSAASAFILFLTTKGAQALAVTASASRIHSVLGPILLDQNTIIDFGLVQAGASGYGDLLANFVGVRAHGINFLNSSPRGWSWAPSQEVFHSYIFARI